MITSPSLMSSSEALPARPFESIVNTEARRLYWLALSILDDRGEAEDAVQETFLKAWRSWEAVAANRSARGMADARLRRPLHQPSAASALASLDAVRPGRGHGGLARLGHRRREHRHGSCLPAAVCQTTRRDHAQLRLRHSVEECAVFMGCRPGTVRIHLKRGLANLRKELKDD